MKGKDSSFTATNTRETNVALKFSLVCFGVFVLIQNLLVENIGGQFSFAGRVVKIVDEVYILTVFLLIIMVRLGKGRTLLKMPIYFPLFGLIFIGFLSGIVARVPAFITFSQLFLLIKSFLIFFIFAHFNFSEKDVKRFVKVFGIFALIVMFFAFVDLVALERFRKLFGIYPDVEWRAGIPSIKSVFVHPGDFGWFMSFVSLFVLSFFWVYKKQKYLLLSLFFFLGVFLSMRVKAFIGFGISALVSLLYLMRCKIKHSLRYFILFLVFGICFCVLGRHQIKLLYNYAVGYYLKSLLNEQLEYQPPRVLLYRTAFKVAKDYFPFGAGAGRYGSWIARTHYSPLYEKYGFSTRWGLSRHHDMFLTDTFWPMIIGETGFIGFFFYLLIIVSLSKICFKCFKSTDKLFLKAFCLGALMVFIEGIVESVGTSFFVKGPQAYFVFAALGMAYSLCRREKRQRHFKNENSTN